MHRLLQVLAVRNGAVLLAKHLQGPYKGEWTGLIGPFNNSSPWAWTQEAHDICQHITGIHIPKASRVERRAVLTFEERKGDDLPDNIEEHQVVADLSKLAEEKIQTRQCKDHQFQWFPYEDIPYHEMPADDQHWYPGVLEGKRLTGHFVFDGPKLLSHDVTEVDSLD